MKEIYTERTYGKDYPLVITDKHFNLVWISRKVIENTDLFNNFIRELIVLREEVLNEEEEEED